MWKWFGDSSCFYLEILVAERDARPVAIVIVDLEAALSGVLRPSLQRDAGDICARKDEELASQHAQPNVHEVGYPEHRTLERARENGAAVPKEQPRQTTPAGQLLCIIVDGHKAATVSDGPLVHAGPVESPNRFAETRCALTVQPLVFLRSKFPL